MSTDNKTGNFEKFDKRLDEYLSWGTIGARLQTKILFLVFNFWFFLNFRCVIVYGIKVSVHTQQNTKKDNKYFYITLLLTSICPEFVIRKY